MKQKKTMKLWQMIVILILSVTMIVTMFLPAFRVDSKARRKQIEVINKDEALAEQMERNYGARIQGNLYMELGEQDNPDSGMPEGETADGEVPNGEMSDGSLTDNEMSDGAVPDGGISDGLETESEAGLNTRSMMDDLEEGLGTFDEEISKFEGETNTKFSKISPFRIMTHGFEKFALGDRVSEDDTEKEKSAFAAIQKKYNTLRVMLWIIFVFTLIIILMVLLGFFLKWNKFIPLVTCTVYSVAASIIFGYLRFGFLKSNDKKTDGAALGELSNSYLFGLTDLSEVSVQGLGKILSCFYSVAFLIAFITGILMILMNVISMLTGNRVASGEDTGNLPDIPIYDGPAGGVGDVNVNVPFPGAGDIEKLPTEPVSVHAVESIPVKKKVVSVPPAVPPVSMGQVRCTKGVAAGQGFMLPPDRKVIVGKSQQKANLIINNQDISNVHCSIRYNPGMNTYTIKDHSMNGTFVNGVRLQKDAAIEYPAGTVLALADGSNEITLG